MHPSGCVSGCVSPWLLPTISVQGALLNDKFHSTVLGPSCLVFARVEGLHFTITFRGQTVGLHALLNQEFTDRVSTTLTQVEVVRVVTPTVRVTLHLEGFNLWILRDGRSDLLEQLVALSLNARFIRLKINLIGDLKFVPGHDYLCFWTAILVVYAIVILGLVRTSVFLVGNLVIVIV